MKKTIIAIIIAVAVVAGLYIIYDKLSTMNAPTMLEIVDANPWTVPDDWLKCDTITIRGHIEDYDAEQFGFTSMACYYEDVFEKNSTVLVLDIADDGTFSKKFQASYPVHNSFLAEGSKVRFHEMPFFARPGETIDITVRKGTLGRYECVYNNSSSDVERWLRTSQKLDDVMRPLWKFEGTFDEANELADECWKRAMARLQKVARSEDYTPMEVQLALADIQTRFGMDYIGCIQRIADGLVRHEKRDSVWHAEILDSVEWQKYFDYETYAPMRRIDFDNPLLFTGSSFYFLLNRIQYAKPVKEGQYEGLLGEEGGMVVSFENYSKKLANGLAALRKFMGTDKDNLIAQLCAYNDMVFDFDTWREDGDFYQHALADTAVTEAKKRENIENWPTLTRMLPLYLNAMTNPYIRQRAEQFRDRRLSQKDLATPLPDVPAAELIRSLVAKFPGKFLVIDFWGMSCGPCRAAIQQSKNLRAKIAKRDDVKLVFIAGERGRGGASTGMRTIKGSDDYKQYIAEWLADEETVCISHQDFARLQDLFQFNGIPHYETITPDCRRVSDNLGISGYHDFENELQRVLEKLSK